MFEGSPEDYEFEEYVPPMDDAPPPMDKLPMFPASDFAGKPVPPREWHVQDIIPGRNVTLLGGDGGIGKSLLAKQLGVSTVLGIPWIGLNVKKGPVIFLSAEDEVDEVHRRLFDITREYNNDFDKLSDLQIISIAGEDALMAMPDGRSNKIVPTPLFDELRSKVACVRPTLVILDTLADLFGGEENQRAQARQFIGMLRGMAIQNSCAVLLLSHPSLSGMANDTGTSGSTGWNNSVRSRLYLKSEKDSNVAKSDVRVLEVMKSNYAPIGNEVRLQWKNGIFVSTSSTIGMSGSAVKAAAAEKADAVFLALLDRYTKEGRYVMDDGSTSAPAKFANEPEAKDAGLNKAALKETMNRLFKSKQIKIGRHGPPSRSGSTSRSTMCFDRPFAAKIKLPLASACEKRLPLASACGGKGLPHVGKLLPHVFRSFPLNVPLSPLVPPIERKGSRAALQGPLRPPLRSGRGSSRLTWIEA